MKNARKALSMILAVSVMGSTCSCSAKFEEGVLDQADKLGKYILDRDYKKIEKMADDGDEKLEAILPLSTDTSMLDNDAREIIASTLTYEVDEDSFEGDFMGKEGSVDIVFTYVDYEKAIEDITIFEDMDAFEAAIEDCDDKVEETITFEFVKDGGDVVCTNIGDIADLFPYAAEEFNFALSRENYAGDIEFEDLNNGSGYIDTNAISCHLDILGDGQELTWNYYYVVECYDVNLYTSSVTECNAPCTQLDAAYSDNSILDDGNYVVTFYTDEDVYLGMASVDVTHTEVTPTPTPTPVPSSSGDGSVGPYYVAPYDGVIALQDTNLTVNLPLGMICLPGDSSVVTGTFGSDTQLMEDLVFFAVNPLDGSGAFCVHMDFPSVDDPNAAAALQSAADQYAPDGATVVRSSTEYTLGDRVCTVETIEITGADGSITYCNFALIGDDDVCYLLYFFTTGTNNIDDFMSCITVA